MGTPGDDSIAFQHEYPVGGGLWISAGPEQWQRAALFPPRAARTAHHPAMPATNVRADMTWSRSDLGAWCPRMGTVGGVDKEHEPAAETVRLTAWVHGRVQGVGFRWWTRARALELGLRGTATNLPDGRVEVVAEGPRRRCEELLQMLSEHPPRPAPPGAAPSWYRRPGHVRTVTHEWSSARGLAGFNER